MATARLPLCFLILAAAPSLQAQSEAALKERFEGKVVTLTGPP